MTALRDYAQLMRLPAMFTVISNVTAACLVAAAYWDSTAYEIGAIGALPFLLTLLASLCLYHGGMVLNDCWDLERDRSERPDRPLPSGSVPVRAAWFLGWGLLMSGLVLAYLVSVRTFVIATLLALAIVAYDAGQRRGWLAAANMGACRYLNWIMAISAVGIDWKLALVPIPVFLYVVAVTLISQQEARAGNRSILMSAGVLLAAAGLCWLIWFAVGLFSDLVSAIALMVALAYLVRRFVALYGDFSPASVQAMVSALLYGIIPLDALLLASTGQHLAALLVLSLMLPGRWLGRFLYIS